MIELIVTGTGRCGTTYLAKLLTSMNFSCGHESIFTYENEEKIKKRLIENECTLSICSQSDLVKRYCNKDWVDIRNLRADSSYLAAPYLDWKELDNVKIIHLYRNPLNVIRSFLFDLKYFKYNYPNKQNIYNEFGWENKIWSFLPNLSIIDNSLERACYFYIEWNKTIKNKSKNKQVLELKIEDDKKEEKIKSFLNIEIDNINLFNNNKENTFRKTNKQIKIKDIPNGKIKDEFVEIMSEKKYNFF